MSPPKIVEIILHKTQWGTQKFLVLDRMPTFLYHRVGNKLLAQDGPFHAAYGYSDPGRGSPNRWKAFSGREFDIQLADGTVENAWGQWWDCAPDAPGCMSVGISTAEELKKCFVFVGGTVEKNFFDEAIVRFTPKGYREYEQIIKGGNDESTTK